jgi:Pyridoxal-phosphate dependent enzyme
VLAREESATEFRCRVYDSILDTIGATPLDRLRRLTEQEGVSAEIFGKCEFFNPLASVKDRIAVSMIEAAERDGRLRPGTVVVEPTSGNTGIGLAFVCAAKGYRIILVMPDSMSVELPMASPAQSLARKKSSPACRTQSCLINSATPPIRRSTEGRRPKKSGATLVARSTSL